MDTHTTDLATQLADAAHRYWAEGLPTREVVAASGSMAWHRTTAHIPVTAELMEDMGNPPVFQQVIDRTLEDMGHRMAGHEPSYRLADGTTPEDAARLLYEAAQRMRHLERQLDHTTGELHTARRCLLAMLGYADPDAAVDALAGALGVYLGDC